ncbi:hypothetical protein DL768_000702 [Monosporascus sp. mg162]|nr:hypothetical protein DL768_000702 [Monosporascus sp. mg162]
MYFNPSVNDAYSILTSPTRQGHARIKRQLNYGFSCKALQAQEEVLRKLESEIRTAFKFEDEINAISTNKIVYFNACVKEGLWLTPAVPFGHPRVVPPGCEEVRGERLPPGTKLSLMAWAMYRSERNFKHARHV